MNATRMDRLLRDALDARINPAALAVRRAWEADMLKAMRASVRKRRRPGGIKLGRAGLTYNGPHLRIKGHRKSNEEGIVLTFDAVVTSKRRDRDGDVLEPAGARIDPCCPLLWQHDPTRPIGRLLDVTRQDEQAVEARFAIADTPLGREAAKLVRFGSLRISHGFQPTKFEPLDEGGEADPFDQGWHVLEYDVLEVSLVSIPSNVDAVISGYA